ncbi:MAG: ABC transporter permease [Chthonomonas sp.]|nr:ABC transporter permease [Chthonomonas sp.]
MNKILIWRALARGVLLESIRRKDLWVVAILGFIIVCSAGALGFFGMSGLESFAKDLAASVLGGFSTILAIVTTGRLMPEETKNRTLYPLVARPISRFDLLFGKFLGGVAVAWISFLILCALTALALSIFGVKMEPIMLQYVMLKMMGLVVVCAVSLMLSTLMTPSAAVTMSFVILFGSSMLSRGLLMAFSTADPGVAPFYRVINGVLPQVSLFDIGGRAANTNWRLVPLWVIGALATYMVLYSAAMLSLSWAKFRRQAL